MSTTRKIQRATRKPTGRTAKPKTTTRSTAKKVVAVAPSKRVKAKGKRAAGAQRATQKRAQAKRDAR